MPASGDHTSEITVSGTQTSPAVSSLASCTRSALPTVTVVIACCTGSSPLTTATVTHMATGSSTAAVKP